MNYRILLIKYIRHVVEHEGTDFLDDWNRGHPSMFSDAEWVELTKIRDEPTPEKESTACPT